MPPLIVIAQALAGWLHQMVIYTIIDMMTSAYALTASHQPSEAREIARFIETHFRDYQVTQALDGIDNFRIAVQNGGIPGELPRSTGQLADDAIFHATWAWRRLVRISHSNDDLGLAEFEALGRLIFGNKNWSAKTSRRAKSPNAE
jgi:hypothetical protein